MDETSPTRQALAYTDITTRPNAVGLHSGYHGCAAANICCLGRSLIRSALLQGQIGKAVACKLRAICNTKRMLTCCHSQAGGSSEWWGSTDWSRVRLASVQIRQCCQCNIRLDLNGLHIAVMIDVMVFVECVMCRYMGLPAFDASEPCMSDPSSSP